MWRFGPPKLLKTRKNIRDTQLDLNTESTYIQQRVQSSEVFQINKPLGKVLSLETKTYQKENHRELVKQHLKSQLIIFGIHNNKAIQMRTSTIKHKLNDVENMMNYCTIVKSMVMITMQQDQAIMIQSKNKFITAKQ